MRAEKQYRLEIQKQLSRNYSYVDSPWSPFRGSEFGRTIYAPQVDVAVGPFAINRRYETEYDKLLLESQEFIQELISGHNQNVESEVERTSFERLVRFNKNSRCFLSIEIENTGGRKHCLGDLVNASALGRVGILIARSESALKIFLKQRVYLRFLAEAGKNTFKTDNALILTSEQFDEALPDLTQ